MKILSFLKHLLPVVAFVAAFATPAGADTTETNRFVTFNPAFASDTPNKIELLEFFSYGCGHCAAMTPVVEKLAKELPENVVLVQVPVAFNNAMVPMQRLYYTLQALNRLDLQPKVFTAIHKDGKRLFDQKAITEWVTANGISADEFTATYNSFGVDAKTRSASRLTDQYSINATPSFVVGGQYLTSPGMTGTYESTIDLVKQLITQVTKK